MTNMLKLWKYDEEKGTIKQVDCPNGGWPAKDADGVEIFDNTHFDTPERAWTEARDNAEAWVASAGMNVRNAESRLQKQLKEAGEACAAFANYKRNYRRWKVREL